MDILNVLAAAGGAFAFGAVWYTLISKAWIAASGIPVTAEGKPANAGAMPFVIGIVAMIVMAGMMRHIFTMAGIDTLGKGVVSGLGIGAFLVLPWVAMNYAFAMRKPALTLIDGGNIVGGCGIAGLILAAF